MAYPDISDLTDVQKSVDNNYRYQLHSDWEDIRLRPDGTGDCKDYVLGKLHALVELGWPIDLLKIAIVLPEPAARIAGQTHAILVVSDHYCLDQRQPPVCTIDELARIGYTPIEIQQRGGSRSFVAWSWSA